MYQKTRSSLWQRLSYLCVATSFAFADVFFSEHCADYAYFTRVHCTIPMSYISFIDEIRRELNRCCRRWSEQHFRAALLCSRVKTIDCRGQTTKAATAFVLGCLRRQCRFHGHSATSRAFDWQRKRPSDPRLHQPAETLRHLSE